MASNTNDNSNGATNNKNNNKDDMAKLAQIQKKVMQQHKENLRLKNEKKKKTRPNYVRKKNRKNNNNILFGNRERNAYSRNMNVHLIETSSQTDIIMNKLKYTSSVGFDCEGIITLGRKGKISLIQVCDNEHIYLFDILRMGYIIPLSLKKWLQSSNCYKFIHDSRQDQDALFHCHDVELGGIFDTTIADLIRRVWISKTRGISRLKGMDSLASDTINNPKNYKVLFSIQTGKAGKFVKLTDLKRNNFKKDYIKTIKGDNDGDNDGGDDGDDGDQEEIQVEDGLGANKKLNVKKWKKIKVNCFDQKQNIKAMMRTDAYLWAKRPIPINLLIYAAVDGYVSLLIGQWFRKKFKQWMIDKALFVSLKWCRLVASKSRVTRSSARVPNSIIKLIRSNTSSMTLKEIPSIRKHFKNKQINNKKDVDNKDNDNKDDVNDQNVVNSNSNDIGQLKFDNLLLMTSSHSFIAKSLEKKINKATVHDNTDMDHVTDVFKLQYDKDQYNAYLRVGKLNYSRLIPLTLIETEKHKF